MKQRLKQTYGVQHPEFVTLGHVTRDLHDDDNFPLLPYPQTDRRNNEEQMPPRMPSDGDNSIQTASAMSSGFSLGGTVTFAALTAARLGLSAGIVTSADAEVAALLPTALPDVSLHISPSLQSTTFENHYQNGFRTQYLRARSTDLRVADVPEAWYDAPILLFGPLAQELHSDSISLFPRRPGRLLAATPQGWLRRWDPDGRVWPTPWHEAEQVLPLLDVLILSHDDLLPFADGNRAEADALLGRWSRLVPLLVATDGRYGASLFQQGRVSRFPAYPVQEVDPTGAGDVFAAAFLTHFYRHGDAAEAVKFANCTAAFSIEQEGIRGIPTLSQVEQRVLL